MLNAGIRSVLNGLGVSAKHGFRALNGKKKFLPKPIPACNENYCGSG
jgi:hypothetical protein